MNEVSPPLVERSNGDIIDVSDHNDIRNYVELGTYRIDTLSLDIGGTEIIDSARKIKPVYIIAPDAGGILFYASNGTTQIAKLDESGNLHIKGRVINL